MTDEELSYPGAPDRLIATWSLRRRRMALAEADHLPPLETDLKALLATPVLPPSALAADASLHAKKLHSIRTDLIGKSELSVLNCILIAHLRKSHFPADAPFLFQRLWVEEGSALMAELPGRWLISSAITFSDHGETEAQRRIGLSMNVLFSLIKLYEFERLVEGKRAKPATMARSVRKGLLPLDMTSFSLVGGGLDINLLAQIWRDALVEPVAGPLACHLLDLLNSDPRTLFRRIKEKRRHFAARKSARSAKLKGAPETTDEPPLDDQSEARQP